MLHWLPFAQTEIPASAKVIDQLARAPISKIVLFAALVTLLRVIVLPWLLRTPAAQRGMGFSIAKLINEIGDALSYAAVVVFMLIRPFGIQTFVIPSGSMIDTLHVGDYIVANKFAYRVSDPKRGDIVVLKPPMFVRETPDQDFIKRLIGLPGDVIEIKDEKLIRNGNPVNEAYWTYTDPFAHDQMQTPVPKAKWDTIDKFHKAQNFKLVVFHGELTPLQYDESGANDPGGASQGNDRYAITNPDEMDEAKRLPPVAIPPGMYLFMGDNRNGSSDGRFWGLVPRDQLVGKAWFTWLPLSRWKMLDNPPAESTK